MAKNTKAEKMLGTKVKIMLLKRQRKELEERLIDLSTKHNGSLTVVYEGDIFPENQEWLTEQGFAVNTIKAKSIYEALTCPIVNVITLDEYIYLTAEEAHEAENFHSFDEEKIKKVDMNEFVD